VQKLDRLVFTPDLTMVRTKLPRHPRQAIGPTSCVAGVTITAVTQGVEQPEQGAVVGYRPGG
jgi:hypothetical protein